MHYFLTFRTYGTWLHGDERGSVDRLHNQVGEPLLGADPKLHRYRRRLMKSDAVLLDDACRVSVEKTIHEVAAYRGWRILALAVLSNHVHVVVETEEDRQNANPEKLTNDFKSYSTRRLREAGLLSPSIRVWEHHGSTRFLKTPEAVENACHYVLYFQHEETHQLNPSCEPGA
jgi:REP element-mobilizing transposase RayT